jgi:hypothetical protein
MMKRWNYIASMAVALLALAMVPVQASAVSFTLADHPDGQLAANGDYGLRVDTLGSLMSVDGVTIAFDPDNLGAGALMSGALIVTDSPGDVANGDQWNLNYMITGLSTVAVGNGFNATGGTGTLTHDTLGTIIYFSAKQNNAGVAFTFADDGHRLTAATGGDEDYAGFDSDSWVGRGWVQNFTWCAPGSAGAGATASNSFGGGGPHCGPYTHGTNDFLFTAPNGGDTPPDVPEPSTLLLTMGGAAMLWLRKRRR